MHLGDFPWPLTPRQLRVLVENLPDDSATRISFVPEAERGWTDLHELIATLIDVTNTQGWRTRGTLGATKDKAPERLPRPRDRAAAPVVDQAALDRVLAHHGIPARKRTRDP